MAIGDIHITRVDGEVKMVERETAGGISEGAVVVNGHIIAHRTISGPINIVWADDGPDYEVKIIGEG